MRACSISGCDKQLYARKLCKAHYELKRRTGSTERLYPCTCAATKCNRGVKKENIFCPIHHRAYINPRITGVVRGEDHWSYKNGNSYFTYHSWVKKNRKKLITERGAVCQKCGEAVPEHKIHQHHIDGNKENHKNSNILLMCAPCHSSMPKNKRKYGDKNLQEWAEYFNLSYATFYDRLHRWQKRTGLSKTAGIALMLALVNIQQDEDFLRPKVSIYG